jgi:general secretion pathway protein C
VEKLKSKVQSALPHRRKSATAEHPVSGDQHEPSVLSPSSSDNPQGNPHGNPQGGSQGNPDASKLIELTSQFQRKIRTLDPAAMVEWATKTVRSRGVSLYGYGITIVLCAYFLSSVIAILLGRFIPEPPVAKGSYRGDSYKRAKSIDDYSIIFTRNLFNSRGIIPGDEGGPGGVQDMGGPPVKTTLPLNLVGTMILSDELRSIATIEDKSASMVYPVRVEDEIPSKVRIVRVEPTRVIFVNLSTGRREYAELPQDAFTSNARISVPTRAAGPGIEQTTPNNYSVQKTEIDKALGDLNNVLTQARAIPNFENGVPAGYKLLQIVPGSIYEKLGLKNNDVIAGVNGEAMTDPGKAFELMKSLKSDNTKHLELQIKRDGRLQTFSYDIN